MDKQEQLFNDIRKLDERVDHLASMYQNSFELMVATGEVTREEIKESLDQHLDAFDSFTAEIRKLRERANEYIEYVAVNDQRRKEFDLLSEITEAEKLSEKYNKDLSEKRKALAEICTHSETTVKSDYIPGGYLEREEHVKKLICKICGKQLDEKREQGGFG